MNDHPAPPSDRRPALPRYKVCGCCLSPQRHLTAGTVIHIAGYRVKDRHHAMTVTINQSGRPWSDNPASTIMFARGVTASGTSVGVLISGNGTVTVRSGPLARDKSRRLLVSGKVAWARPAS